MSNLPLTYSLEGRPRLFGANVNGLVTAYHLTIVAPTRPITYIIQGLDVSGSSPGISYTGTYDINGGGDISFWSYTQDLTRPLDAACGSWRGALPLSIGSTFVFGVHTGLACTITLAAWGIVVPYEVG
jgi:hypothetical protein